MLNRFQNGTIVDFQASEDLKNNDLYKKLPRTTLRYAIEKFEETKRQSYLKSTI